MANKTKIFVENRDFEKSDFCYIAEFNGSQVLYQTLEEYSRTALIKVKYTFFKCSLKVGISNF